MVEIYQYVVKNDKILIKYHRIVNRFLIKMWHMLRKNTQGMARML